MAQNLIKWTRSDYAKLSSAVRQFNKEKSKLEKIEKDTSYLPDTKMYQELKERIVSRRELNRVINSLKRFSLEKNQEMITTPAGEEITRWEYKEINYAKRRAIRNLTIEKMKIEMGRESIGMGDKRIREIDSTIKSFGKLETKKGSDFNRIKNRILTEGTSDRELYKAKIFQENYYKALEDLKNFDNYDLLIKELNKYKNPISFYNRIQQSSVLADLLKWYKGKDGEIMIYGEFDSAQQAFNYGIEDLGIELEIPNVAES